MTLRINRVNLVFGLIAWLGIAQFVLLVLFAISIYADGYSIHGNFLSDLGCLETVKGADNRVCASIFNRSIIALGVSLLPFFVAMPMVLQHGRAFLSAFGVLSAFGLVGIGLTPYDRYFIAHHVALGIWIVPMLVMVIAYFVCSQLEGVSSATLLTSTILVVLAVCGYAFAGIHEGHVVFQKVLVILAGFWFLLVFAMLSVSTIQSVSSTQLMVDQQATEYLAVLRRNHKRRCH